MFNIYGYSSFNFHHNLNSNRCPVNRYIYYQSNIITCQRDHHGYFYKNDFERSSSNHDNYISDSHDNYYCFFTNNDGNKFTSNNDSDDDSVIFWSGIV